MVYKRGDVYWYHFQFLGQQIQESTHTTNQVAARQIEAAHRVRLAKGEAGLSEYPNPTLAEFAPRFMGHIETECAAVPATIKFYRSKLDRLLEDAILPGLRLSNFDEAVIDAYKQRRRKQISRYGRPMSPASVNRELATLRRLLRLAKKWKEIPSAPEIELLEGEVNREFVLSHQLEPL
jgi:hypothetical protein